MLKLGLSLGAELGILLILGDGLGWEHDTDAWSRTAALKLGRYYTGAQGAELGAASHSGCTCAKLGALLMIEMSSVQAGSNTHTSGEPSKAFGATTLWGCTGRKA
jgi:hypothetical protein